MQRPSGIWYVTPFYECVGCSVMFRDPVSFSMCFHPDVKTSEMRGRRLSGTSGDDHQAGACVRPFIGDLAVHHRALAEPKRFCPQVCRRGLDAPPR